MTPLEQEYWDLLPSSDVAIRDALSEENADLRKRLNGLLAVLSSPPQSAVHVGVYPSGQFAAGTALTSSGALILLHHKLPVVARAVAAPLAKILSEYSPGEKIPDRVLKQARWMVRFTVSSFVTHDDFGMQMTKLNELGEALLRVISGGVVHFVIAHELAHVVLEHFADPRRFQTSDDIGPRIALPSWQMEVAADKGGILIARPTYGRADIELTYLGPALFFEILEMARRMRIQQRLSASGAAPSWHDFVELDPSHPKPEMRLSALIGDTHPDGPSAKMPYVGRLVDLMRCFTADQPPPDEAARKELSQYGDALTEPEQWLELLQRGNEQDGVVYIDAKTILERMREDSDQAMAVVAKVALEQFNVEPYFREGPRMNFGLLYFAFYLAYFVQRSPDVAHVTFDTLLRRVVPEANELYFEVAEMFARQTKAAG